MSVLLYNETTSWQELAAMIHPTVSIVKDLNNTVFQIRPTHERVIMGHSSHCVLSLVFRERTDSLALKVTWASRVTR